MSKALCFAFGAAAILWGLLVGEGEELSIEHPIESSLVCRLSTMPLAYREQPTRFHRPRLQGAGHRQIRGAHECLSKNDPFCYVAYLQGTLYSVPPPPSSGGMSFSKAMSHLRVIQRFLSGVQPIYENSNRTISHKNVRVKVYQMWQTAVSLN